MDEKEEAKLPRIRRLKSDLVLPRTKSIQGSEDDETYKQICSICLKEYLMDEEIAWSNNSDCNHMFHLACIEEWLLRHDECPCCRQNYLGPLSQNCDHDLPRQPSVPPLVASMHSISLSQDPDFLGMIASIDAMYRRAHARLLYEDSVENHGHSEGDDGLSPSLSQSNTTLSSHFAGLESPMASESHEGRNSSSVDQSRAGWSPSSNEDNI